MLIFKHVLKGQVHRYISTFASNLIAVVMKTSPSSGLCCVCQCVNLLVASEEPKSLCSYHRCRHRGSAAGRLLHGGHGGGLCAAHWCGENPVPGSGPLAYERHCEEIQQRVWRLQDHRQGWGRQRALERYAGRETGERSFLCQWRASSHSVLHQQWLTSTNCKRWNMFTFYGPAGGICYHVVFF